MDIHNDDFGFEVLRQFYGFLAVTGFTDHLDVRITLKRRPQPLTHHDMIIHQQNADLHATGLLSYCPPPLASRFHAPIDIVFVPGFVRISSTSTIGLIAVIRPEFVPTVLETMMASPFFSSIKFISGLLFKSCWILPLSTDEPRPSRPRPAPAVSGWRRAAIECTTFGRTFWIFDFGSIFTITGIFESRSRMRTRLFGRYTQKGFD